MEAIDKGRFKARLDAMEVNTEEETVETRAREADMVKCEHVGCEEMVLKNLGWRTFCQKCCSELDLVPCEKESCSAVVRRDLDFCTFCRRYSCWEKHPTAKIVTCHICHLPGRKDVVDLKMTEIYGNLQEAMLGADNMEQQTVNIEEVQAPKAVVDCKNAGQLRDFFIMELVSRASKGEFDAIDPFPEDLMQQRIFRTGDERDTRIAHVLDFKEIKQDGEARFLHKGQVTSMMHMANLINEALKRAEQARGSNVDAGDNRRTP